MERRFRKPVPVLLFVVSLEDAATKEENGDRFAKPALHSGGAH